MKKLFIVILGLCLLACNNSVEKSEPSNESNQPVIKNNGFYFKVKLKSSSNDQFRLILNEIKDKNNQLVNIHVSKDIIGDDKIQTLLFESDKPFFPEDMIIDLGKKNKKSVIIDEVIFKSGKHELTVPRQKIDHFFYPNKFLEFNKETLSYKVNTLNKNQLLIFRQRIIDSLWIN